ncbi:MAG: TlpA family protein disulfide reductase [Bacteroidaceae bacterium]|nr:TlpA family protein disulfide reductase [Bacteroidaceae bacterium]
MVFNDGSEVSVDVVNDVVKGSGLNEKWGKYLAEMNGLKGQVYAQKKLLINTCKDNKDNKIPVAAIMLGNELLSSEVLAEVLTDDAPYAKHPFLAQIVMIKKSMEKRMSGSMLKDISIPDADGKMHKLSDFVGKGKYVLVDFWASWCGPCCREMPNVVAAYNEYKSKEFEIVGVSLDQNKDKWLGKVKELGMTWPQLSDLKGWKCEAAALYGVQAIPSNVLFDKEGKVVATDLMGNQLQDKLQEIFK